VTNTPLLSKTSSIVYKIKKGVNVGLPVLSGLKQPFNITVIIHLKLALDTVDIPFDAMPFVVVLDST